MILDNTNNRSKLFTEGTIAGTLKNPNEFREAIIYESLSQLDSNKKRQFVNSSVARTMVNENILSHNTLERLAAEKDGYFQTAVCHIAKDNEDPEWMALMNARLEERRIMNDLIAKYGDEAKAISRTAQVEYVEKIIPKEFQV